LIGAVIQPCAGSIFLLNRGGGEFRTHSHKGVSELSKTSDSQSAEFFSGNVISATTRAQQSIEGGVLTPAKSGCCTDDNIRQENDRISIAETL
jgi:hypothetical protein